jgi:hypothetical protein
MRKLFENLNRRDKISVSLAASKKVFLALCHDWRCVFSTAWLTREMDQVDHHLVAVR